MDGKVLDVRGDLRALTGTQQHNLVSNVNAARDGGRSGLERRLSTVDWDLVAASEAGVSETRWREIEARVDLESKVLRAMLDGVKVIYA